MDLEAMDRSRSGSWCRHRSERVEPVRDRARLIPATSRQVDGEIATMAAARVPLAIAFLREQR